MVPLPPHLCSCPPVGFLTALGELGSGVWPLLNRPATSPHPHDAQRWPGLLLPYIKPVSWR